MEPSADPSPDRYAVVNTMSYLARRLLRPRSTGAGGPRLGVQPASSCDYGWRTAAVTAISSSCGTAEYFANAASRQVTWARATAHAALHSSRHPGAGARIVPPARGLAGTPQRRPAAVGSSPGGVPRATTRCRLVLRAEVRRFSRHMKLSHPSDTTASPSAPSPRAGSLHRAWAETHIWRHVKLPRLSLRATTLNRQAR